MWSRVASRSSLICAGILSSTLLVMPVVAPPAVAADKPSPCVLVGPSQLNSIARFWKCNGKIIHESYPRGGADEVVGGGGGIANLLRKAIGAAADAASHAVAASEGGEAAAGGASASTTETSVDPANAEANAETGAIAATKVEGDGEKTGAIAGTEAEANAHNEGNVLTAAAEAEGGAGAIAVAGDDVAAAASVSEAEAAAVGGKEPGASASAGTGVFAAAVGGEVLTVTAVAGPQSEVVEQINGNTSVMYAYGASGAYSVAVASKKAAGAFAATGGEGGAGTPSVGALAKSGAFAGAWATRTTATAFAGSHAGSKSWSPNTWSLAAAASHAFAKVEIRFIKVNGPVASKDVQIRRCVAIDWKTWRSLPAAEREKDRKLVCEVQVSSPTTQVAATKTAAQRCVDVLGRRVTCNP